MVLSEVCLMDSILFRVLPDCFFCFFLQSADLNQSIYPTRLAQKHKIYVSKNTAVHNAILHLEEQSKQPSLWHGVVLQCVMVQESAGGLGRNEGANYHSGITF